MEPVNFSRLTLPRNGVGSDADKNFQVPFHPNKIFMSNNKNEKTLSVCKQLAAEFLEREGNRQSIITVTNATISNDRKYATIFFTVLPTEQEKAALAFAKRQRSDFRKFVGEHARLGKLPFFDFAIDEGEKHRQRIDNLSQTSEK